MKRKLPFHDDATRPYRALIFDRVGAERLNGSNQVHDVGAQLDRLRARVGQLVDRPIEYVALSGVVNPSAPGRSVLDQAAMLVETGEWNLIVAEDVTRIGRDPQVVADFVQSCVRQGVRVIGVDDGFDSFADATAS